MSDCETALPENEHWTEGILVSTKLISLLPLCGSLDVHQHLIECYTV